MQDKISIVIPVYNVSKYLPKCIDSVLNQTYKNLEIILVNDGSTDESGKICDLYSLKDKRIKVIHKENGGSSDARNAGLREAAGKYIGFVDSDDFIETDMYEVLLKKLYAYDADIVQCAHNKIINGKIEPRYFSFKEKQYHAFSAIKELILRRNFNSAVWDKLYKKELLQGIEFPVNIWGGEDIIFIYKVFAKAQKLVSIDIAKYYYVKRQDSLLGSLAHLDKMDMFHILLERLDLISKNFPSLFHLAQMEFYSDLIKRYKILSDNNHIDKDKKKRNLIKDYITTNYISLSSNPLFTRKTKVLLKIFKINFRLGYYLFYINITLKGGVDAFRKILRKGKQYYKLHIKPHLPLFLQKTINVIVKKLRPKQLRAGIKILLEYLRVQKPVTRVLGPQYHRSRKFIEIDIICDCNLKCYNCDRSCTQAPSQERMTTFQIQYFINASIAASIHWECVRILGGEPTLHPDLLEIIDMIRSWKKEYSPETRIELVTNGYGLRVKEVLKHIPKDIMVDNTNKDSREQDFCAVNIAPSDLAMYRCTDFRNGCKITTDSCGIGFTPYGFYPCGAGGAIDRVFGLNIGRDSLPAKDDDMYDQLEKLCRLCGHFFRSSLKVRQSVKSKTWEIAYQRYHDSQPVLPRFGDSR
jgi:glycosyltransferase involved in cell wall biosynthesis